MKDTSALKEFRLDIGLISSEAYKKQNFLSLINIDFAAMAIRDEFFRRLSLNTEKSHQKTER